MKDLGFKKQLNSYYKMISMSQFDYDGTFYGDSSEDEEKEGTQGVTGSIFTLISTAVGTGVLSLPYSIY